MSGGAIAALVLAGIAAAIAITLLVTNNQQRTADEELARERARNEAVQPQEPQQPVVVVPQPQPPVVPAPVPSQPAPSTSANAPTSTELELDIRTLLLSDSDLKSSLIDVKVSGSDATLSGEVPNEELRMRAEQLARRVRGLHSVTNSIVVKPE